MSRIQAGEVQLGHREWGEGEIPVLFVHGNLASKDWLELAAPWFPKDLRVIGVDWRGCGESDRPAPTENFANYAMRQHASDMLAALDTLGIERCHLATHSTGGIISAYMLLDQPGRFGRVLHLDPVSPRSMPFNEEGMAVFRAMQQSREATHATMATAAASLFSIETLAPGKTPAFREGVGHLKAMFEKIVDQTFSVGEGIFLGTPTQLTMEFERGELFARMGEIGHETLILWGEQDFWIPRDDMDEMAARLPNARLVVAPGVGHSMNIEQPQMYAGYFGGWFSGVPLG